MSILIKDMEMPTTCFYCPLSVLSGERLFCEVTKDEVVRAKRPSDCPLVPVPPHGRLIDADTMITSIKRQTGFCKIMGDDLATIAEVLEKGFLQEIENAPTIIPADGKDIKVPTREEGE